MVKKEKKEKDEVVEPIEVEVEAPKVTPKPLDGDDIIVEDPQVLRPVELPLVITPKDGKWKSKAQEKFARVLNGYAYKNPKKFKAKQAKLIAELRSLATAPDPIEETNLSYKNNLAQ
ncbi:MAG: hypothetical protein WC724_03805 [Candidatus Paceibacterota bacterium]|jgi:hypothetical protein